MRSPSLVKDLCLAMRDGAGEATPITVKCRIGVDDDDSYEQLAAFVEEVGGWGGARLVGGAWFLWKRWIVSRTRGAYWQRVLILRGGVCGRLSLR